MINNFNGLLVGFMEFVFLGRMDSHRGHKMALKCSVCKRPLGVFFVQKSVNNPAKIVVLNGSVHKTKKGNIKIISICKCGEKTVFENNSETPTKQGWRRVNTI